MTVKSNILIIGSTGRNTGKTVFACKLIENHSAQHEIIGVKVIPVDKNEVKCHRGSESCGICSSLIGDYQIIEEVQRDTAKDTSRMLRAGAQKSYLLLIDRNSLEKGIQAFLKIVPEKALIIIESNTIRNVLEPGLFVVIKELSNHTIKQTCSEVITLADKISEFDKLSWDFHPDKIVIQNNRWIIKE